jgi:choline dehydrogenase-like flavoprotein
MQGTATAHADVVVVGSGMGGSTAAWALARRGVDVLVVERGERLPREPENFSPREVFLHRRYRPVEQWLDGDGRPFGPGVHYVVGGNTKVYGASLPRLRESDFGQVEHREGVSPGWPFTYRDLEPYYGEAEQLYRVHGRAGEDPSEPWRSGPFPYPAVPHEPYVTELADRLRAAGVTPAATCMGIDLRPSGSCVRCATCDGFPCRYGAKSDAETCALDPALQTGRARLLTGVRVRRVATDGTPDRISHLEAEGPEGPVRITADRYVLAAGAVNSAALLLASRTGDHPGGLANSSDQVGRSLMMHNNAHLAAIDLNRRNDVVFQKTLQVNDWYHDGGGDGRPLGSLQLIGKVQGVMMKSWATRVPLPVLDRLAARSVEWLVMAEDLPRPENRVTLTADGTIRTARRAAGMSTHRVLHHRAKRLMRAAGYDVVATQPFDISMNSHQCGTLVAGRDPARSVLDPYCRSHDVENLWVLDASFFPSSGAMNPALTIAAQALRVVAESGLAG